MNHYGKKCTMLFLLFGLLVFTDQYSKYLAKTYLIKKPVSIIPKVFELRYLENPGAAWGILKNHTLFFGILTVAIVAAILLLIHRLNRFSKRKYLIVQILLTVLSAGAVGNFIDRMINGYVIDYFYFKWIDFPIFNVADCYVTVSVALLLVMFLFFLNEHEMDQIFGRRKEEK